MLIFFYNDKCSKNKCSDVSIFKGKARNVDYVIVQIKRYWRDFLV